MGIDCPESGTSCSERTVEHEWGFWIDARGNDIVNPVVAEMTGRFLAMPSGVRAVVDAGAPVTGVLAMNGTSRQDRG